MKQVDLEKRIHGKQGFPGTNKKIKKYYGNLILEQEKTN